MKKYIVKFGYFLDQNDIETSNEEVTEIECEKKTEGSYDILGPHKELEKLYKKRKEEIISILKKEQLVTSIYPLETDINIKNLFSDSFFGEPIKFKIKLPLKCQDISQKQFYNDEIFELIEDFNIIFDGNLFAIYQEVNPSKIDFLGGPDVRENINKLFPNLKTVAPTPFRESFIYLISYPDDEIKDEMNNYKHDFVFPINEVDFEEEIYNIFYNLEFPLRNIYETYCSNDEINDTAHKILDVHDDLNSHYKDFIDSKFLDKFNKKKSLKLSIQNLYKLLLDYALAVNRFEVILSENVDLINRNNLFKNYVEEFKNEANGYVKIDVEVMFKYVDSIINELDTRSINLSTIASGIIGGVIGAVSTIILTIIK